MGWAGGHSLLFSSLSGGWRATVTLGNLSRRSSLTHLRKIFLQSNQDHDCIKENTSPLDPPNDAFAQEVCTNDVNIIQQCCTCWYRNFLKVLIHIHSLPDFFLPAECILQSVWTKSCSKSLLIQTQWFHTSGMDVEDAATPSTPYKFQVSFSWIQQLCQPKSYWLLWYSCSTMGNKESVLSNELHSDYAFSVHACGGMGKG